MSRPTRNTFRAPRSDEPGPRRRRMALAAVVLAVGMAALVARAWYLQVERNHHYLARSEGQYRTVVHLRARRGRILDRNGRELALSAAVPSVYANPSEITSARSVSDQLAPILGRGVYNREARFEGERQFTWIARHINPEQAERIEAAAIPGVYLTREPRRFYPNRGLAGALIGFAGIDGNGLEGIERDFDRYLRGGEYTLDGVRDARGRKLLTGGYLPQEQLSGQDVHLTLDVRIQQVAEEVLTNQVWEMEARSGVCVVMDPNNGDILALAQTPVFDPNLFRDADPDDWRLRPFTDVLEPGSTIKPFLVAAALDAGRIRPDTKFDGMYGHIRVGGKIISDVHGQKELTTETIIQKSSNVGAVQVGQRLGREQYHAYLQAFGFGAPTGLDLAGEQSGYLRPWKRWGQIHLATISYGYGISATPLQMARAMSAIANGGRLVRPRLVRSITDARDRVVETYPTQVERRVLSPRAAAEITKALEMVTDEGGTGRKARVPGYRVAGKTGTARLVDASAGGYSKSKVRSSFIGFVPAEAPKLVIVVVIDEPLVAQYGGVVAAPVFAAIGREVLPYLGVQATEPYAADELGRDEAGDLAAAAEGIDPQTRSWWFEAEGVGLGPGERLMPDLRGQPLGTVVAQAAGWDASLEAEGAGVVVSQRPPAGALLRPTETVTVYLGQPGETPEVIR